MWRGGGRGTRRPGLLVAVAVAVVIGVDDGAHQVDPQTHELAHLLGHGIEHRVALVGVEAAQVAVERHRAFGQGGGRLQQARGGEHGRGLGAHRRRVPLTLDGRQPTVSGAQTIPHVLHASSHRVVTRCDRKTTPL